MGVRGLTKYVNSLPTGEGEVWEAYELRNTTLILDGDGLSYEIYYSNQLNCTFGGQYSQLEDEIKKFFHKLTSHRVVPYVIFDGIMDESHKKLETLVKRRTESITRAHNLWKSPNSIGYDKNAMVLPRLTQLVFLKILREIGVKYAFADYEADSDIASLANALKGPVMGSDSDYFIFDITQGYIPFDCYDFSGPNMKVKRFHSAALAKHLNISQEMLPLLASLVGNDYVSHAMLFSFTRRLNQSSGGKIASIAEYLSRYDLIDEVIANVSQHSQEMKKALWLSVEEYQPKSTNLLGYLQEGNCSSKLVTYRGHGVPSWIIRLYREGSFSKQFYMSYICQREVSLKTQVEDMNKPSAHQCTVELRKHFYKLLLEYEQKEEGVDLDVKEMLCTEYVREGLSLVQYKTVPEFSASKSKVDISKIRRMSKESKMAHLLNMLSCDSTLVQQLAVEHQLLVAALRYWLINTTPPVTQDHLAALLVHYVGEKNDRTSQQMYHPDVSGLHGFSQWQNIVYWADQLNSLFSNVLPSLQLARLYDGVHACVLYHKLKSWGIQAVEIVIDVPLFQQLHDAALKDLPSREQKFSQVRSKGKSRVSKKPKEVKPGQNSKEFVKGNHFALLSISSESDEED